MTMKPGEVKAVSDNLFIQTIKGHTFRFDITNYLKQPSKRLMKGRNKSGPETIAEFEMDMAQNDPPEICSDVKLTITNNQGESYEIILDKTQFITVARSFNMIIQNLMTEHGHGGIY